MFVLHVYTIITIKHILMECADLVEVRKTNFEEKSLHFFQNVDQERIFEFLKETGVFDKIRGVLYKVCVECFKRELSQCFLFEMFYVVKKLCVTFSDLCAE